ncbi:hypothetical protein [Methylobacterium sp. J-077]|uniref:hypothetical protein n=1 Tax=Methylobacterium sp. J-077 TaxID=2836656 RepID=UPI001FBAD180|nr:hypothetical protein [Methylobacterium sp. J-077]MCJ2126316.1 hypothetical protein [Methylobacterium sp. J-077]
MRALMVGAVGVLGALCLSSSAMAQSRNKITINLYNKADHSFGLHDVASSPSAKSWNWSPETVRPGGTGIFSGYWDDNQGQSVTVEVQGMTPGPYGCLVSCAVTVNMPLYEATSDGLKCPTDVSKVKYSFRTTSNNNVCGNVTCKVDPDHGGWPTLDQNCNYTLNTKFTNPNRLGQED